MKKVYIQALKDYAAILFWSIFWFLILPLKFKGPGFNICQGLGSPCRYDATRWHWFAGYNLTIGPDTPINEYGPANSWEGWVLVLISIGLAIFTYWVLGRIVWRRIYVVHSIFLVILAGSIWYAFNPMGQWGKINFQEYSPSYLPGKMSIGSMMIYAESSAGPEPVRTTSLNINLSRRSYILENKVDEWSSPGCSDTEASNTTCVDLRSTSGRRYTLRNTSFSDNTYEQSIELVMGDTSLNIFMEDMKNPYPTETIDRLVDSLKKVHYGKIQVEYDYGHGV